MATIQLSLPDELCEQAQRQAAREGYKSVEAYFLDLLQDDLDQEYDPALEAALLKGANSPSELMTDQDWDEMCKSLIDRHGRQAG